MTNIPKISAKFLTTLAKRVNIGDTTATLSSIKDLDLDSLPSGRYGFTVDEGNSQIEYFEADLSGSALSNIKRLDPTTLVETTGFLKEHRAGSETKITDYTVLARIRAVILGEDDLDDGSPIKYGASPSLSDPLMLATVEYVLSVVNGGTVSFDNHVIAGIAGESISSGQWVYFKESDGRWYLTDANTQATVKNVKIGMAKGAGTTGNAISGGVFVGGIEKTGSYTLGQAYYISNTAGALSTSAGEYEALVGIGDANGKLVFLNVYDPEGTTPEEKDAMQGTVGTPNANNKFVTENGSSASGTDQEQTTQNSSVEFGEANATTKKNKIAQSFKPTKNKIRGVKLYKSANTGTAFTGTVTVTLQSDSSGSPDGVALATKVFTNLEWNTIAVGEMEAIFATEYTSMLNVPETTYWIVIESSTSDNSNHPNLGFNTAGGYSNGTLKYNNTTDGWVEITGDDLYFKTLEGNISQFVKTDSEGHISKEFFKSSKMPLGGFHITPVNMTTTGTITWTTVEKDGSVFWSLFDNSGSTTLKRFERDANTGVYVQTHGAGPSATRGSLTVLGDYLYYIYDAGTNLAVTRYNKADLTGSTSMTVPTVTASSTANTLCWNDGTYFYIVSTDTANTVNVWSVSGTAFSAVTTNSWTSVGGSGSVSTFWDSNYVYIVVSSGTGGNPVIRRLDNINGSSYTTVATIESTGLSYLGSNPGQFAGIFILPIDSSRIYQVIYNYKYDSTNYAGAFLTFTPITKPY